MVIISVDRSPCPIIELFKRQPLLVAVQCRPVRHRYVVTHVGYLCLDIIIGLPIRTSPMVRASPRISIKPFFWSCTDQGHGVTGQHSRDDPVYELVMVSYIAASASAVAAELTAKLPLSATILQYFPFDCELHLSQHRFNSFVPHWCMRKDCISFDFPSLHDVLLHRHCHDRRGIIWQNCFRRPERPYIHCSTNLITVSDLTPFVSQPKR